MTKKAPSALPTFHRPKGIPRGTIFYLDETREPRKWIGGLMEYERMEAEHSKSFGQVKSIDDMRRMAYFSLVNQGFVDEAEEPYEVWAPKVLWMFDDSEADDDAGEASPPTT